MQVENETKESKSIYKKSRKEGGKAYKKIQKPQKAKQNSRISRIYVIGLNVSIRLARYDQVRLKSIYVQSEEETHEIQEHRMEVKKGKRSNHETCSKGKIYQENTNQH